MSFELFDEVSTRCPRLFTSCLFAPPTGYALILQTPINLYVPPRFHHTMHTLRDPYKSNFCERMLQCIAEAPKATWKMLVARFHLGNVSTGNTFARRACQTIFFPVCRVGSPFLHFLLACSRPPRRQYSNFTTMWASEMAGDRYRGLGERVKW